MILEKKDEGVILLVEDNPDDAELTIMALQETGIACQIVHACDGVEALDYAFKRGKYQNREAHAYPHLVLLDLKLPKIDGHQVLAELRAHNDTSTLPVIILTTSNEEKDLARGYELGVNSYLRKPIDSVNFTEVVRQLSLYWLLLNTPPPRRQGAV